jgi:type I restriction-modification system DNA methylase subunit
MTTGRKTTNEQEFQGTVLEWLNAEIKKRPGLELDRATQEKPRKTSGKRSDVIVWKDRTGQTAFLATELKTPDTPLNDPQLFADAVEKAQHWQAPYFAIWNMREAELYTTPPKGGLVTPADVLKRWPNEGSIRRLEDWLRPENEKLLEARAVAILEAAWVHQATDGHMGQVIDAEIFVSHLSAAIGKLREILYRQITRASSSNRKLRQTLNKIAAEQGFKGFVEDIELAIAGQMGYRLIGQILFYFALRRKQPTLRPLHITREEPIPAALIPFWNDVRRFDYEALFRPDPLDQLVAFPDHGQLLVRSLIEHLAAYDWASLTDDVLGAVFERLIPREEQILLGQFYTPRSVADFLVAMTLDGERPIVLDPGCGSGTFLMSAYDCIASRSSLSHKEILPIVWGFDISPFAAELAAINLFRQDLSEFDNFPRIVPGNFFERQPGQPVEFPPPRVTAGVAQKVAIPIPQFNCIVGNPPYLRAQNQDDLDPGYKAKLFTAAAMTGIKAEAKTDLFAFFIYHALQFLPPGGRLGFVTPASWLTADYGVALQKLLLGDLRLVAVVASNAEAFFPQVDVNAVLLVAERIDPDDILTEPLRFVNLKQRIDALITDQTRRWQKLTELVDFILENDKSFEDNRLRVKVVSVDHELEAFSADPTTPRNWSKYLRAPLSYYQIFGDAA